MSEQFIPHPPSPQPQKASNMKQMAAIVFLIGAVALLIGILIAPGDKQSSPPTTLAPVVTNPPVTNPPVNKYDQYMDHVLNNSGQANTWSKADVIKFGDLVCQALDNGNSVRSVVNLLNGYTNTTSDAEFFASVMYGSITYLCPEYVNDMNVYLAQ